MRGSNGSHEFYCVEDESQPGTTSAATDYVMSPMHLRVPTFGDKLKRADPRSRAGAVAGNDRAAVMMGGHMTDAIWYLDPTTTASYVTLPDHKQSVPDIVKSVNARVRSLIARPAKAAVPPSCAARSMAIKIGPSGHAVGVPVEPNGSFRTTPSFDKATADIAIGPLRSMRLGRGPATDVLAIGLSANDYVGHAFGTEGAEMALQQAALDRTIGRTRRHGLEHGVRARFRPKYRGADRQRGGDRAGHRPDPRRRQLSVARRRMGRDRTTSRRELASRHPLRGANRVAAGALRAIRSGPRGSHVLDRGNRRAERAHRAPNATASHACHHLAPVEDVSQ
jgi:hypothetical protein